MGKKMGPARASFQRAFNREMSNEYEVFEGHVIYYALDKYRAFLARGNEYPIIRLDDLNHSLAGDAQYFKHTMEWLTQTEWPDDYVKYVQENNLPCQLYDYRVEWDKQERVKRIHSATRDVLRDGGQYNHWGDDPSYVEYWNLWDDKRKAIYLRWFGDLDRQLGYNQSYPGSTDTEWEFAGKYDW